MARTDTGLTPFTKGHQYVTRVNTGGLDVERHTDYLNRVYAAGYRLHSIFEQKGNTVMVFERRAPSADPSAPEGTS
jgi:hypothetical protein